MTWKSNPISRWGCVLALIAGAHMFVGSAPAGPRLEPESIAGRLVSEVQTRLPDWIKQKDAPGAAMAIVDDKAVLWQGVYGTVARGLDKPVTPRTLFSIQSMSKSFTALGVLMAVQDGLLDLDAPITEYLPDFGVHSPYEDHPERRMTLRHLLSHKAGFTHEAPVGGNFDSRPTTFGEHVLSFADTWLRYPVGYRYSYSNIGIDLAGYVLEKKAGKPFTEYIRDKVLVPLEMYNSTLDIKAILSAEDRARGHLSPKAAVSGGVPVEIPMVPAGGVYTNILDMACYLMFHINEGRVDGRAVLRGDLMKAMHSAALPEPGQTCGYGLGLMIDRYAAEVCYSHGGGGYGFGSLMVMFPGLKLGFVYLANSEQGSQGIGWIRDLVVELIEKSAAGPEASLEKPAFDTSRPLPPEDVRVRALTGLYENEVGIGRKEGRLGITLGKEFNPLTFFENGGEIVGLYGKYSELRVKPPVGGRPGTLVRLNRLSGNVSYHDFHKPEKPDDAPGPDQADWKPYLGLYRTLYWGRASGSMIMVGVADGYLTCNGMRCREHLPGLFFTYTGEALDFRGTIATFRNIPLVRVKK